MTVGSVQLEIHRQVEDRRHGAAVVRAGFELPAAHGLLGFFRESHRQAFHDAHFIDVAVLVDHGFDDDDAGDARFAGAFGVLRLGAIHDGRRFDVAADAHRCRRLDRRFLAARAFAFRSGAGAADLAAEDAADFAAFDAADLTTDHATDFTSDDTTCDAAGHTADHARGCIAG